MHLSASPFIPSKPPRGSKSCWMFFFRLAPMLRCWFSVAVVVLLCCGGGEHGPFRFQTQEARAMAPVVPVAHALRFDLGLPGIGSVSYRDGLLRIKPSEQKVSQPLSSDASAADQSLLWKVPDRAFLGPSAAADWNAEGGVSIEHRLTADKGYGAFLAPSQDPLPPGTFLGLYEGELLSSRSDLDGLHASRRQAAKNPDIVGDYVMSLDGGGHFLDGYDLRYDPTKKESFPFTPAHLNHASRDTPGCNVVRRLVYVPDDLRTPEEEEAWLREEYPRRLPRVAFFAGRDIAPGEELCFDYGDNFWSGKDT